MQSKGFTLIELTVVLMIVALLASSMLMNVSAQRKLAEYADTQRQMENIREAMLGYAMTNGNLPCPANPLLSSDLGGNEELICAPSGCPQPPGSPAGTPADKACAL